MLEQWVDFSLDMAERKADFYSGARKIIRGRSHTFHGLGPTLLMKDCGFTKSKTSMLTRNYLNEESRTAAIGLWERRLGQGKYGSIGFSCYNHYVKGGGHRSMFAEMHDKRKAEAAGEVYKIGRASVMGPCIQGVTLTLMPKGGTALDIFYRTTELFKKFPADLVFLRDVLLPPFKLERAPVTTLTCHFANITCHPMYFVTLIPSIADPVAALEVLRKKDPYFFNWIVKWTSRYLVPKHFRGIDKFAQAMRVRQDALARIDKAKMREVIKYMTKHHPGYRNKYVAPDAEDEE